MEYDAKYTDYVEICDLCHDYFDLLQIRITEHNYLYCDRCLGEYAVLSEKQPKISNDIRNTDTV